MNYDVIVLGGGPGGYLAAERAAQAGLKTACIEDLHLGGTCLNEGCIPTKTLLNSGKLFTHAKNSASYGVHAENVTIDHNAVIDRKEQVIKTLVGGVAATLKACKVDVISARGIITGRTAEGTTVEADGKAYTAKNLIIATGSSCAVPPIAGLKEGLTSGFVLTNKEMLNLRELPRKLVVLGGGVIGLEMATYYAMAGVDTTVIEMLDHIGGPIDADMVKILQKNCEAVGMHFLLQSRVSGIQDNTVIYEKDGKVCKIETDKVLLSIGRRPNGDTFGAENIGLMMDRGAVVSDEHMRTNIPGVYAVGDVNGKAMLAHTAYREAEVAVNHILGKRDRMRYNAIPSVLYTVPELSAVGETEASAKAKGMDVKVVKLPMVYSGRYVAENQGGDGICKVVFDKATDTIVGAQALANYSSEFIVSVATFMEMEMTADDIKEIVFPHPTVSEILREAVCQYKK